MLKKIIILLLITLSLYSCKKDEKNDNIDNLNNWVIIDNENKVDELWVWSDWNSSTFEVNWGFNN